MNSLTACTMSFVPRRGPSPCSTGLAGVLCLLMLLSAAMPVAAEGLPWQHSRQLLLVLAADWSSVSGTLQRYARQDDAGPWQAVGGPVVVSLGRSGQGWGRGLHPATAAVEEEPAKCEGDGRAPTGVYALPGIFASGPDEAPGTAMPLTIATPDLVCVDDAASRYYNTVRSNTLPEKDWTSAEDMLRQDGQYRLGAFVDHNQAPPEPEAGSCIFMHVVLAPGVPTAGCTAMDQESLRDLLQWLDPAARPVLAQFPRVVYERLRQEWGLP